MAQHDYVIDNQSAPLARADINAALQAIVTQNAGASAPATTYADMFWYDTTNNQIKKRNEANSAWITLGTINEATGKFDPNASFTAVQQGGGSAMGANKVYLGWDSSGYGLRAQIDTTLIGRVVTNTAGSFTSAVSSQIDAPGNPPLFTCRAWAFFNGTTGGVAGSGNISSVVRNGPGDYTVNFNVPMPDAAYAAIVSGARSDSSSPADGFRKAYNNTTTSVRILTTDTGTTPTDHALISVSIFR